MGNIPKCELCGGPMPEGEEMFKYHGYSGPCPQPPCPFCNSDKTSIVVKERGGGQDIIHNDHIFWSDGENIIAFVICCDCGAKGPSVTAEAFDIEELDEIKKNAAGKWATRAQPNEPTKFY